MRVDGTNVDISDRFEVLVDPEADPTDLDEALAVAARVRIPTQNCVVADSAGRIGWTLMGPVAVRRGVDGRLPQSWSDGRDWAGLLPPDDYPGVVDPPDELLHP